MKVFISRNLETDSVFKRTCESNGLEVSGLSFIEIEPVRFSTVPKTDWIFFYSKNGVKHFFSQLSGDQRKDLNSRYAAIGSATAESMKKWEVSPTFIGSGDPASTAEMFAEIALGQIVLFPRAEFSRRSVQGMLDDDVQSVDLVVYSNKKIENPTVREEEILVFTSPLNVGAYFDQHELQEFQRLVAIGQPTADKFQELGFSKFFVSDNPSEEALSATILKLKSELP